METSANKVKQAYVEYFQAGDIKIAFNCLPGAVKHWAIEGRDGPDIIVIGDTAMHKQVAMTCPEFPMLKSIFAQGGFDFGEKKVTKPLILVGDSKRVKAHAHAIRLAFHGPSETEHRSQIRTAANVRKMLLADQVHLANKDKDGEVIPFEDYVVQRPFDPDDNCAKINDDLEILHVGKDKYIVRYQGEDHPVDLTSEGIIGPSWTIPVLKNIQTPHHFRVFVLGSSSGFGAGPTTCYLLEMNGEFIMWDCSPYASWTLSANGIDPGQVKKIIVSHIHDDHLSDLIPFALSSYGKVEIMATREIIYSLKVKLAALMNITVERLNHLFTWTEIKVNKPVRLNGFDFDFHYGFHPIPSLGAKISHNGSHYCTITGDTGFAKVLEPALEAKAISKVRADYLLNLLKEDGVETIFADIGEQMIHGFPDDLESLELPYIQIYHRPELPEELRRKANLVVPGNAYCIKEMDSMISDVALLSQVFQNLGIIESLKWVRIMGKNCQIRTHEKDSLVIQQNSTAKDYFYVITHGQLDVIMGEQVVATLTNGDFFGEQALLEAKARNANIWAKTPVRLMTIPADLFIEMIAEDQRIAKELTGQENPVCALTRLETIWEKRLVISQVEELKYLPTGTKNELALQVDELEFSSNEVIVRKGSTANEVYIIVEGKVEVRLDSTGRKNPILLKNDLFGEGTALGFSLDRSADVRAVGHTVVYRISGDVFRDLYDQIPRVHFELGNLALQRELTQE
jgi:CRP-like cAMP-binding protein